MRTWHHAALVLALAAGCKKNQETPPATGSGPAGSTAGSSGSSEWMGSASSRGAVGSAGSAGSEGSAGSAGLAAPGTTTSDAALSAPAPIDTDTLLQVEAIGPLAVNMTDAAVTKLLGAPKTKSPPQEEGATGQFVSTWSWPGVDLEMAGDKRTGPTAIRLITIEAPSAYATKRGIHIGSTLADVARLYPKSDEGSEDPTLYLVGSVYGGLLFETKGDAVVKIVLGPMAF